MNAKLVFPDRVWLLLFSFITIMTACNSVKHSYHSGNFEKAVEKSVKKLKSNPKDDETILYLTASYSKLYRESMDRITFLKKEGRPENVLPVYDEMTNLRMYEDLIKPLLPLYITSKKENASFTFIHDEDLIAAKQNAAEYLYAYSNKLLNTGDNLQARQAYELLQELKCIYPDYKDANQKMNEALAKGTNQVYLKMENNSNAYLFEELEKQITSMPVEDLNSQWVNFYDNHTSGNNADYNIIVNIRQIVVTPDMQATPAVRTETKTIQDGWNYVLDSKGNVKKDSSGNDIKTPKYKTIQCVLTEYLQQKSSSIIGTLDFYNGDNSLIYSYPFSSNEMFQHPWATANGDLNALSKESHQKIQGGPIPYPTEIDMLLQAGEDLKIQVKNTIRDKMDLVMN